MRLPPPRLPSCRELCVSLGPTVYHPTFETTVTTVAIALALLPSLRAFDYACEYRELPLELQLAIVTHPSLRTLVIDSPHFAVGYQNLDGVGDFERVRDHPLVIPSITYSHTHDMISSVSAAEFYARLGRHKIQANSLVICDGTSANVDVARLLPSVADFGLTSIYLILDSGATSTGSVFDTFEDVTWVRRLLGSHPSLSLLSIVTNRNRLHLRPRRYAPSPWAAVRSVDGLDRVVSPGVQTWLDRQGVLRLEIRFRRDLNFTKIVGLDVEEEGGVIGSDVLAGLADFLPHLESLSIQGPYCEPDDSVSSLFFWK